MVLCYQKYAKLTTQSFRAGSISHYGRLNIYGSPINTPERSFPRVIKAVEGKPFVVHCPVAGFPIQDVEWFKGNILEVALYFFERYFVAIYMNIYQQCSQRDIYLSSKMYPYYQCVVSNSKRKC